MLTASIRRTVILVSLVAALATPWASAAGPGAGGLRPAHAAESATPDFLDLVFRFFRTSKTPVLKEGCKLDPNGRCNASLTQPPSTKAGCKLDPNGFRLP